MSEPADVTSSTGGGEEPGPTPARRRGPGWGVVVLLAVVAAIVLGTIVALVSLGAEDDPGETVTFVVPDGTAEARFYGNEVDIMPPEVELRVGDTLVVRNEDSQTAAVGPFTVRAGETLTQTFQRPQTLVGECSLSGTGEVAIIVTS